MRYVLVILLVFQGCAGPRYADGTKAALTSPVDRCDPKGDCNVGKRP